MFEMIGLLVGTAILFVLSVIAGGVYAGTAFLILWGRPKRRIALMLLAAAIPVCSTAYMWLCVAILPGESLFGDIDQPLPNGYTLQALGKNAGLCPYRPRSLIPWSGIAFRVYRASGG